MHDRNLDSHDTRSLAAGLEPIEFIGTDSVTKEPDEGTGLCLSGGGYRAMLFHVGAVWRLYEANMLKGEKGVTRISSVSGGSITAGVLGLNWSKLSFDPKLVREDFVSLVVKPIRKLAGKTLDASSIIGGILKSINPGTNIQIFLHPPLLTDSDNGVNLIIPNIHN